MTKRRASVLILIALIIFSAVYSYYQRHREEDNSDRLEKRVDIQKMKEQLYVIRDNGRYGYIDRNGFVIIKPQYEEAYYYNGGLARVRVHNKYGFIDKAGNFAVQPKFDDAADFAEGMALVGINNKYGFINTKGEVAIPLEYDSASSFSEGLAGFYSDGKWGYMNNRGDVIIQPRYENAGPFVEGMAAVSEDGLYGFINNMGEYAIKPHFAFVYNFSEGMAEIAVNNRYGFIDVKGNVVIPPKFEGSQEFRDGRAAVMLDGKWGFIDKKSRFIVEPVYKTADSFSEGLAAVNDGKAWGYIDRQGVVVLRSQYAYADRFFKGLATVRMDDVLSMINEKGKLVWHETERTDIQGPEGVMGSLIKMKITSDKHDLIIKYPYVSGMQDKTLQNRINELLMRQSGTDYKGRPDETYRQDYDVMLNKNGIMSIVNNSYMYVQGAAHGMSMRSSINIDMTTGRLYSLQELFKPGTDYKSRLNNIIKNQIAEGNIPLLREFQGINDNQEYYLTDKELVIYYQLYDYTPYAYGFLEFYIPYEKISNMADKKGPIIRIME